MESSRIFVRGLPPNLSAEDFRRHFSKQCAITDAKFIPHRRIGYVGYKNPEEAAKAVKYHHKSFIRMSRIGVELARSVGFPCVAKIDLKLMFYYVGGGPARNEENPHQWGQQRRGSDPERR